MDAYNEVKVLLLDIETSFMVVPTFTLYPKFLSHKNILQDWHIICAAWKWEGEKKVHSAKTYTTDDKEIVVALREAILEADVLVYHNGKKFDYRKLNTRVLMNGLEPMNKPRELDTLLQCRKHFGFTSNRLDYIAKVLGFGGKISTSDDLWIRALDKDTKAIDEMDKYCKNDVIIMEKVYQRIKPHIDVAINRNINTKLGLRCPSCQSDDIQFRGYNVTKVARYRRMQCRACGKWSQSGTMEKRPGPPIR